MKNEIARAVLIENFGDKSDLGLVYINEIHAYDENDEEISDNEFINAYNRGGEDEMFFFEEDEDSRLEIISQFANKLGISADIIDEELI